MTKIAFALTVLPLIMLRIVESTDEVSYIPHFMLVACMVAALGYLIGDMTIRAEGKRGKALVDLGWLSYSSISALVAVLAIVVGWKSTVAGVTFAALSLLFAVFFRLSKSVHEVLNDR